VAKFASHTEAALLKVASHLACGAGRGLARRLSRLDGGKNNQVYRVETDSGEPLVLKRYFSDPRDPRDRLAAEWDFLQYIWSRGIRAVPEPLARDTSANIGLYGFVAGRKLSPTEVTQRHIDAAIDFLLAVNASPRGEGALSPASEACSSLADHLATVDRRVGRLTGFDPHVPHVEEAQRFVAETLLPAWADVKLRLTRDANAAGLEMERVLQPHERCLSPSDFGFHNVLSDDANARLAFLDFEYAGWDDPAKLISDFFCQPEIPVPFHHYPGFLARLADGLGLDDAARTRCRILIDVYRVKWSCILLNDFQPIGAARRSFADGGDQDDRCARQIAKAQKTIGEITR
jgi:aminoglycoside phosphotransferase (APT) family kinase protein